MEKPVQPDLSEVSSAAEHALAGTGPKRGLARPLPFLGPAFIASITCVDPGNFATNIQGGAQFGCLLLWVVVASNLMAMLIMAAATFHQAGLAHIASIWTQSVGARLPARTLRPVLLVPV